MSKHFSKQEHVAVFKQGDLEFIVYSFYKFLNVLDGISPWRIVIYEKMASFCFLKNSYIFGFIKSRVTRLNNGNVVFFLEKLLGIIRKIARNVARKDDSLTFGFDKKSSSSVPFRTLRCRCLKRSASFVITPRRPRCRKRTFRCRRGR